MMKRKFLCLHAALLLVLAGCVIRTEHKIDAHITLDIRHVQEQAGDVLNYIEGKSNELPGLEKKAESTSWLWESLKFLDPFETVQAAEMKSDSARVKEIATELRKNNDAIAKLKKDGCLGETNRGYVELKDCDATKDADTKNKAQTLLAEENKGRKALYTEIARLNKDEGLSITAVEQVYAVERLKRGVSGEQYQLPSAGKLFDEIKASKLGKALGAACKPDAWVTIP